MAEIWAYLTTEASETVANRFLTGLVATCEGLLQFPFAHPERRQLAAGLRVAFHGTYAIYYLPEEAEVIAVRVLHGSRDLKGIADSGGFGGDPS